MPSCSSEFITRWTGDFAALVVSTRETISDWEFRNGVYDAGHYDDDDALKPIFSRMERPDSSSSGAPQRLQQMACKKVPVDAEQVCSAGHMAIQNLHSTLTETQTCHNVRSP